MAEVDEHIQDAMRKGEFANLPGQGKPLRLSEDPNTPEHLRMAHKLLRDNDLVPEWMAQGKELDSAREKLAAELKRAAHSNLAGEIETLREAARKYNSQVLSYNLKVPRGVSHKRHFDFDAELRKSR